MQANGHLELPPRVDYAGIVVLGFATTVAMWTVGYFARLPALVLPSPVVLVLMLICLVGGGVALGRLAAGGIGSGIALGAVAGLLNLMILGSLLTQEAPNSLRPGVAWWVPGSIVASSLLAGVGAFLGSRGVRPRARRPWIGLFAGVAVTATLLLLAVGGLVTSAEAGMAVYDWPTSFGHNMFLYPLSRMTGGIYYEHAHRLFGALVGLTTLVLAVFIQFGERRPGVRALGWAALVMVIVQGLLGGFRVTEQSLVLAMSHGILGQVFFATLVALGALTSGLWLGDRHVVVRANAGTDRTLSIVLVSALIGQLVLGASQRHLQGMLLAHMFVGLVIVAPLALQVGLRAWGLNSGQKPLQRLGLALVGAVVLQILLGIGAYVATVLAGDVAGARVLDLTIATGHQWFGGVLLAMAVLVLCFNHRLLAPANGGSAA